MVELTQGSGKASDETSRPGRAEGVAAPTPEEMIGGRDAEKIPVKQSRLANDHPASHTTLSRDKSSVAATSSTQNTLSRAVHSVGTVGDEAILVVRDVLKGTLAASGDIGNDLIENVALLTKSVVHGATDAGGDIAIAVRDSANAAVTAIDHVGVRTIHALAHLLTGIVSGIGQVAGTTVGEVKTVLGQALPRGTTTTLGKDAVLREETVH